MTLKADGAYLVTGGRHPWAESRWAGEQGAVIRDGVAQFTDRATWIGARRLSTSGAGILAIERLGATVDVAALDIADGHYWLAISRFGRRAPPLRGLCMPPRRRSGRLHGPIKALMAMLRPKVAGTWALHRATEAQDLDFFVLFSSMAALLGSVDLGHYAAANSFLDSFASYRRSTGHAAVSINWGAWADMRDRADREEVFASSGMRFMAADRRSRRSAVCGRRDPQWGVASVDWTTFKRWQTRRQRPFLDRITAGSASAQVARRRPRDRAPAQAASAEDRRTLLSDHVRAAAAAVLRSAVDQIDVERFVRFGNGFAHVSRVEGTSGPPSDALFRRR
jgi:polyketide synthase 12/myxalamid-type polyketide synthase MxaB